MGKITYNTFGTITKKEQISTVENETNSRSLILETLSPFPGYHGTTVPDKLEPDSLFAITSLNHNTETMQRAIQEAKKDLSFNVDAAPANLSVQNEMRSAIRIKGIRYDLTGDVLAELTHNGITFRKTKKIKAFESIIKVHKFFSFKKLKDNFYADMNDEHMYYFSIPGQLRWQSFEKMTYSCKNNCPDNNFDAAMATVYMDGYIVDMVRIFDMNYSQEKLDDIRKKYMDAFLKL